MSAKPDGGPAFPLVYMDDIKNIRHIYPGMTLRDYFAGQALTGLVNRCGVPDSEWDRINGVKEAYLFADAMLAESIK